MNINELDSYNLADAVKFNKQLNPAIWQGQQMRPEVREKLLAIAEDFKEFLGLSDLNVKDITVSGSNAGFTYTPHSDIDLHLVVDIPQADSDEIYRELFDAKKYQYNDQHNLSIGGYDVELYVENANQPPVSQGTYSVLRDDWINIPKYRRATVNDDAVRSKFEDIGHRIEAAVKTKDFDVIDKLASKIKKMRQAALDKHGELGSENLAYKILRNQGMIKKLYDARAAAKDAELSLAERARVKPQFRYGFKAEDLDTDGVMMTEPSNMSSESVEQPSDNKLNDKEIIVDFIKYCAQRLKLENVPQLRLRRDPQWSIRHRSFGRYDHKTNQLEVSLANRHIMDVLRTIAHELVHQRQDEVSELPNDAGETGSKWENEANAKAGVIMRDYADANPQQFADVPVNENASGYIPKNRKEARLPQYQMALSVDIKPGQIGKEANKLGLKTNRQGQPALIYNSTNRVDEAERPRSHGYNSTPLSQVPGEQEDDLGNQEATGPEFEPQMPAGTTKVEVGDLTDWYRLGMDISDMDDADPEDYNQGPPQTVIVFPSDEAEQGYLKQFKRLGLKTHDLDPDVAGGEDVKGKHLHKALAEELQAFKEQDLFEVKMTSGNLAKLAQDIKGAKVGLEFEMIVPNTDKPGDSDMEPDYDQDDRVRDIDDCVNFFDDGDYNSSGQIRRLRSQMEEDYYIWRSEMADNGWYNGSDGFDYFRDYLEREDPFDEEEAEEEARNQLQSEYGDELDVEEFEKMLFALVDEKRENYVQDQWDEQGRNFDDAREEYIEERVDDYSEQDWLQSQGIRYASDVESNYGDVTWPYYTSNSNNDTDIKSVALDFMNAMGMDSVAVSNSYHGNYERWDGDNWVNIGSNKPDDCFAIEPDGSLEGNDVSDAGLEFVSPPIPLEDIGTVMKKVQDWAGRYGAYTGKGNKTSIHTNISVPGYDLKNLDYLKAALLLGDEYVLREFGRIGNTYAKPAIEKVKQLVNQKPEKARELLDKMKSQLNAEASKLIHSGVTDKFTSINTKDNRIEFRSPGGDYLSIIADDPQKMVDTINRMVVTMDAALDPNKYKEEYQKKLYKLLTGQSGGREAKSGAKQEMKKDDKDLLNIFSRYAAGELPKAALKSFVRQAQTQRKLDKGDTGGEKFWWNVKYNDQRMEVVATNKKEAKEVAAKEWGLTPAQADTITSTAITVLRPYTEPPAGSELERIERQAGVGQGVSGLYKIFDTNGRLIAGDEYGSDQAALARAGVWAMQRGVDVVVKNAQGQEIGRVSASGEITPTAQQNQGNWGIWIDGNNRFANQPGTYARGETPPLYRFPSREAAESWLAQQRAERAGLRTDIEVREIAPRLLPGSTLDLQRQRAAQASPDIDYEIYNRQTGEVVDTAQLRNDNEAMIRLNDYRNHGPHRLNPEQAQRMFGIRRGPGVSNAQREPVANIDLFPEIDADLARARAADAERLGVINTANEPTTGSAVGQTYNPTGTGSFTGQWLVLNPNNQVIYRFGGIGNSQSDANRVAMDWLRQNPRQMVNGVSVVPEMG